VSLAGPSYVIKFDSEKPELIQTAYDSQENMSWLFSRRQFLGGMAAAGLAATVPDQLFADASKSPFRVAVITDEITQDLGRALEIVSKDFGLQWVELRGMWNKNVLKLDSKEISEVRKLLERYKLRVTDIASPLFKVDWPGAPTSKFSPKRDQFGANFDFKQQNEVLEQSVELAHAFNTDRVRCFDFWRLDDVSSHRKAIDDKLREAAEKAGRKKVTLVLENEMTCNTATGKELARTLAAVKSRYLMANWDPGNASMAEENPYPDGYELLPKDRIGHCHCKDIQKKASGDGQEWAPVGGGTIDWVGQYKALRRDGYHLGVSLETHWRGAGTPEASSRASMAGMQKALQQAGAW
jgi:sugar phosphate isomerase/epimerase